MAPGFRLRQHLPARLRGRGPSPCMGHRARVFARVADCGRNRACGGEVGWRRPAPLFRQPFRLFSFAPSQRGGVLMNTVKPLRIDIVSDVVCPWCYIGKRRIENALALTPDVPVEIHWRPFFLNSWVPREGISRDEYLTAKFGSPEAYKGIAGRVVAAANEAGLTYRPDLVRRQPNTIDCHRLIHWAEAEGKAADMKQRLMELYFRDGGDLTHIEVRVK